MPPSGMPLAIKRVSSASVEARRVGPLPRFTLSTPAPFAPWHVAHCAAYSAAP